MSQEEDTNSTENDDSKYNKLQKDLLKMKKVCKMLMQTKQSNESKIKSLENDKKEQNELTTKTINDLQQQINATMAMNQQYEDIIDNRNNEITALKQKIAHSNEAVILQTESSQQILQELNSKCAEYEEQIAKLKHAANTDKLDENENNEQTQTAQRMSIKNLFRSKKKDEKKEEIIREEKNNDNNIEEYEALKELYNELENESQEMRQKIIKLKNKLIKKKEQNKQMKEQLEINEINKHKKFGELYEKTMHFKQGINAMKDDIISIGNQWKLQMVNDIENIKQISMRMNNGNIENEYKELLNKYEMIMKERDQLNGKYNGVNKENDALKQQMDENDRIYKEKMNELNEKLDVYILSEKGGNVKSEE
eukprot:372369_1